MAVNCPPIALLCLAGALLTTGASQAVGNDQGCPDGWTQFGTRCFKFFDIRLTWAQAEKSCQSHGANLASIHSAEEHGFVADLTKKATGQYLWTWVGGHDAVQENLWLWSDGSVWDYSNWGPGQPDNLRREEHCLMINWRATLWNDESGNTSIQYICAKDAEMYTSLILGNFRCKCAPNMH